MSNIELSTKYSSKRSFGWSQDASDFNSLKNVVQIFDNKSKFHENLIIARLPMLVDDRNLVEKFQTILKSKPLKITYADLVGTHSIPRKNSQCNSIIQASVCGQVKPYITDWASDSFLRWAHLCGFIKYNGEDDTFEITEDGLAYSKTENNSNEEKECLLNAILKYPPVSRILQLLSNGEHLSKFEIGSKLGFVGDEGFTSLPQNILLTSLAMTDDLKEKNKMKSDWDGSSDKYARQICKWLQKLGLVRQVEKEYKVIVGNKEYTEKLGQAYLITPDGLKAYRKLQGINKVSRLPKNVFWEMLCTKATDRYYIRNRRAYLIKFLSDSNSPLSLTKLQEKLKEVEFEESIETIRDDLIGLQNIGLFVKESSNGFILNDDIQNLVIPINSIGSGKSDTLRLKDFCRDMLENISHNYLNLIDLAYDPKSNRQFEMEVVDLFVSECGYKGIHLGGGRKPDGIIYTENLKENYGTIIDTKAYSKGYSLPISQADEMRRYVEENNKRDVKINSNKWWNNFPDLLNKFSFLFVSSEFNGQFEEKLENIAQSTKINGGALNVVNLLILAENIKSKFIDMEQVYNLITQNSEIKLIDV
jgi:type-2 restriction enzyme fokI